MKGTLYIVIPAYNEEENIEKVVGFIKENYSQYDYVVVNDGSKDKTADICREKGFELIDLPINLGLAGARIIHITLCLKPQRQDLCCFQLPKKTQDMEAQYYTDINMP